mmetsp:Transcript_55443/g.148484  ORF Transcript_55443/g.148484 Transcript_55443/m.148484 type:complete len:261 (-) Transcript_55443:539-1321(-)
MRRLHRCHRLSTPWRTPHPSSRRPRTRRRSARCRARSSFSRCAQSGRRRRQRRRGYEAEPGPWGLRCQGARRGRGPRPSRRSSAPAPPWQPQCARTQQRCRAGLPCFAPLLRRLRPPPPPGRRQCRRRRRRRRQSRRHRRHGRPSRDSSQGSWPGSGLKQAASPLRASASCACGSRSRRCRRIATRWRPWLFPRLWRPPAWPWRPRTPPLCARPRISWLPCGDGSPKGRRSPKTPVQRLWRGCASGWQRSRPTQRQLGVL